MPPAKTASPTMETTLAAIVAHPTRARCFSILAERTASPVEIAQEIGKDVGHVGYHVRKLQQLDLIELVDERPVRGAVEHFYRAIARPCRRRGGIRRSAAWRNAKSSRATSSSCTSPTSPARWTSTPSTRDRTACSSARRWWSTRRASRNSPPCTREMYERTMDIQAQSDERRAGTDDEGISTMSTNMFFEMPKRTPRAEEGLAAPDIHPSRKSHVHGTGRLLFVVPC